MSLQAANDSLGDEGGGCLYIVEPNEGGISGKDLTSSSRAYVLEEAQVVKALGCVSHVWKGTEQCIFFSLWNIFMWGCLCFRKLISLIA